MSVLSNDSFIVFAKTCLQKGSGTSVLHHAKATSVHVPGSPAANGGGAPGQHRRGCSGERGEGTRQSLGHFYWQSAGKMQNLSHKQDCCELGKSLQVLAFTDAFIWQS